MQSWEGLIPGISTNKDAIKTLGQPIEKGQIEFMDRKIPYYAYKVNGGKVADFAYDRIFFRPSGVIDWIEIIVADRSGDLEPLIDTVMQIGNKPDVVFTNSNYIPGVNHAMAGPDQIYVWSECGSALDALCGAYSPEVWSGQADCLSNQDPSVDPSLCSLLPRFPDPYAFMNGPEPDIDSIVLMRFYFEPTSYQGFASNYMHRIPYGEFDKYLYRITH